MAVNYHTWQPATIHGIPLPNMAANYHISHPTTIYGILLPLLMLETQKRDTAVSVQDEASTTPLATAVSTDQQRRAQVR